MRAFEAAIAEPWAIHEDALKTILAIAERDVGPEGIEEAAAIRRDRLEAVEAASGPLLEGTKTVTIRDGVAVVPVVGPMFRYANLFTELSGATSLEILGRDFSAAFVSGEIRAVLLAIDSPGGTVNGTNEFSKMVRAAAESGEKPIVAYVSGSGASAAYWIASAANRIIADETALLGSIGVVMAGTDDSERRKALGLKDITIVSSQSPKKRADPTTKDGLKIVQDRVDRLAAVFIERVAAYRGVSVETVQSNFGQGDVLLGHEAVSVGMADGIGSFEAVLADLAGGSASQGAFFVKGQSPMTVQTLTAAMVAAEHPEVAEALRAEGFEKGKAEGRKAAEAEAKPITAETVSASFPAIAEHFRTDGATAERTRILDLEASALPGFEALVAECKRDGKSTAADLAVKTVALQKQQGSSELAAMAEAAAATAGALPAPAASEGGQPPAAATVAEGGAAEDEKAWNADADLRADFGDNKDAYLRFRADQRAGNVRAYSGKPPTAA